MSVDIQCWLLWNLNWTWMRLWIPVATGHSSPPFFGRGTRPSSVWSLKREGKLTTCSKGSVRDFKGFLYHLQTVSFMCVTFQASFFPPGPSVPIFYLPSSWERMFRLSCRWVFSPKAAIYFLLKLSYLFFPPEMPLALVSWDWKDSDPSLTNHVCLWRWSINTPWHGSLGNSLFYPLLRGLLRPQVKRWTCSPFY